MKQPQISVKLNNYSGKPLKFDNITFKQAQELLENFSGWHLIVTSTKMQKEYKR